jgi:hypothetical protein
MPVQAGRVHSITGTQLQRCGSSESMRVGSASCGSLRAYSTTRQSSGYRDPCGCTDGRRSKQNEATPHGACDDDDTCHRHKYSDSTMMDICPSMPTVCGDFGDKAMTPCGAGSSSSNEPGCRRTARFLYNMWTDQKLCDVVLRCVGASDRNEVKILAHKVSIYTVL